MKWGAILLGGGGAALVASILFERSASAATNRTARAVASGGTFKVHATGYWPVSAKASEKEKMEGPPLDRRDQPLHSVEDFFAGRSDHASAAGDPKIFPYGQLLTVDWFGKPLKIRVVDTGQHFKGAGKVYKVKGEEPIDFRVVSPKSPIPEEALIAQPVAGDHWDKAGKAIASAAIKDQTVVGAVLSRRLIGLDVFACGA